MRLRTFDRLPEPPRRSPYLRARLFADEPPVVLRFKPLSQLTALLDSLPAQQQENLGAIALRVSLGEPLFDLLTGDNAALAVVAGLLAALWADPIREIETKQAENEDLYAFGARVLEEFRASSIGHREVALLGLVVADAIREMAEADRAIAETSGEVL